MVDENSKWAVSHYKRQRKSKRLVATIVAIFDTAREARQLIQCWRGHGQVYAGPCDSNAKVTPAGKRRMTAHLKNSGALKISPDPSWVYVAPNWNHQTELSNAD